MTNSVEVFLPFGNKHCLLPSLPEPRFAHTMDGFVICGGDDTMSKYEAHWYHFPKVWTTNKTFPHKIFPNLASSLTPAPGWPSLRASWLRDMTTWPSQLPRDSFYSDPPVPSKEKSWSQMGQAFPVSLHNKKLCRFILIVKLIERRDSLREY